MTSFTPPAPHIPMPPVRPPARKMGIRMSGCEAPLEDLLRQHVALYSTGDYTLVEIGSAGCVTLRAFRDIVAEMPNGCRRAVIGVDLIPEKAWSLDMAEVNRSFYEVPHQIVYPEKGQSWREPHTAFQPWMTLCLLSEPRVWLAGPDSPQRMDFVFIDGCHGKCSGLDFLAIERKIVPGGVVVFHDYGEIEQGTDWQHHCREFINVRTYVHRLGLAQPCNEPRKGWRFLGEIPGSRRWGGDGNSAAVVQRTNEALEDQPALSLD
jgi:hypothetical protein